MTLRLTATRLVRGDADLQEKVLQLYPSGSKDLTTGRSQ